MKTNVQISSIEHFHGAVQGSKEGQHRLILSVMDPDKDYTGQELSHMTGLPPNTISARLFELREEMKLVKRSQKRSLCPHSKVRVFTHRKLPQQKDMFA